MRLEPPEGQGSVLTSTYSLPDTGMHEESGPGRRAQRGCVLHPLCALDLSRSKVLNDHQHSTTHWYILNNQAVLNRK